MKPFVARLDVDLRKSFFAIVNTLSFQFYSTGFMTILYIVHYRLSQINQHIEEIMQAMSIQEICDDIRTIARCVHQICNVLDLTKFCYTFNNVSYLLHFCFHTILCIYSFISYFSKEEKTSIDLSYALLKLLFELFYSPFVIWTFIYASRINSEGKRMEVLVQKMSTKFHLNENIRKDSQILNMQLGHCKPIVGHGLFEIDLKLLFCGMCACFSYLIVIVQSEIKQFD